MKNKDHTLDPDWPACHRPFLQFIHSTVYTKLQQTTSIIITNRTYNISLMISRNQKYAHCEQQKNWHTVNNMGTPQRLGFR